MRATKAEVNERRSALYDIVAAMKPMTVRQVFYQATVRNVVEKTEAGYTKVQTDLVQMRRTGELPYSWLADNTRWQRRPRTFDGIEPGTLRELVETTIHRHLPRRQFDILKAAEESERSILKDLVAGLGVAR
ncbi:hypothetical protein [Bradyrhizobium elkanii]|uniref:hypothetical protein n=1 Tax=Bradyrhizobium elkanii TaxID=29448 RepID=UPI0004B0EE36|nr:hypothetical protein [Bradyrhizobium elkanii]